MPDDLLESSDAVVCIDFETGIGEGPVWDDQRGVLWFVDIPARLLLALNPASGRVDRFEMPDLVTSIGLMSDEGLVLSLRKEVCIFAPATGKLEVLCRIEGDSDSNRLNDGKVGPDGCFWVGSMFIERPAQPTGALYRVTPQGEVTCHAEGIHVSNGLAWSPDHGQMYHADSRGSYIRSYDFDPATGCMTNPHTLATPTLEEGLPDGAAVDCQGNYWSAGITAGCLNVFAPDGSLRARLPAGQNWPTMPCFGGADGRTLFVTGLSRDGHKGTLTAFRSTVTGTPVARFGCPLVQA